MKSVLFLLPLLALWSGNALPSVPSFYDRRDYAQIDIVNTTGIAVADANGDGIPDVIGVASKVGVQFGNGDGTFRTGPVSDVGMGMGLSLIARDLNADGRIDLVVVGGTRGLQVPMGVGIAFGNGDGTFKPVVFYQAGSDTYINTAVVGDFNGDGIPDIAAEGKLGLWLFTGQGGGNFDSPVFLDLSSNVYGGIVAAADINGDGNLDLIATTATGFTVLLGNGDGSFQPQINTATTYNSQGVAVGDLNRDGHPDVVIGNPSTNHVFVYLGHGDGTFSALTSPYLPAANTVAIGDVNGDGIPDLISQDVHIALGRGDGTFSPPIYYPVAFFSTFSAIPVVLADLRGNGLLDIITANTPASFSVLLSLGRAVYLDGVTTHVSGTPGCGVVGDFNRDGKPDVALSNGSGMVMLFGTGRAASPFTIGPTTNTGSPYCAVKGDLNNDGIPDLLIPFADPPPALSGTLVSYLGNGDGTFRVGGSSSVAQLGVLKLADFNGDGKLDYVLSTNLLAFGNGDGTFQAPNAFVPKIVMPFYYFSSVTAGDLNGDHFPDIVLTDGQHSFLYILLNNHAGGFRETVLSTSSACYEAQVPVIADVDGDGSPDLTIGCYEAAAAIYLNNGHGVFTYSQTIRNSAANNGAFPVVGDLNGDGIPDIALVESTDIAIYIGSGGGTFEAPFFLGLGPAPGEAILAPFHGQSPGRPDILVPDTSGRVLTIINTTPP